MAHQHQPTVAIVERVRGPWRPDEDEQLRELVEKVGPQNWSSIALNVHGRSAKSCRLRWYNQLSPTLVHGPFTREEDEIIIDAHKKYGNKWATIARLLPGRTDNSVKNRWHATLKRKLSDDVSLGSRLRTTTMRTDATVSRQVNNEHMTDGTRMTIEGGVISTELSLFAPSDRNERREIMKGMVSEEMMGWSYEDGRPSVDVARPWL